MNFWKEDCRGDTSFSSCLVRSAPDTHTVSSLVTSAPLSHDRDGVWPDSSTGKVTLFPSSLYSWQQVVETSPFLRQLSSAPDKGNIYTQHLNSSVWKITFPLISIQSFISVCRDSSIYFILWVIIHQACYLFCGSNCLSFLLITF